MHVENALDSTMIFLKNISGSIRKEAPEPFSNRFADQFSDRAYSQLSMNIGDERLSNVLFSGSGGVELTRSNNPSQISGFGNNEGKIICP